MIASWRGLWVTVAIAVVLVIAVVVDLGRVPDAVDRALVPGFDAGRVTELIWERADRPAIHVVRDGDAWALRPSSPMGPAGPVGRADPAVVPAIRAAPRAVGDVLAALRGARWHRALAPTPVHATLTVIAGGLPVVLGLGEPIAGTDQSWINDGARGLVVDSWVVRALDRDALSLRDPTPLGNVRRAQTVDVSRGDAGTLAWRLEGVPRRLVAPAVVVAQDLVAELERALADVTIVRLPDRPASPGGLAIAIAGDRAASTPGAAPAMRIVLGGSCAGAPELVAMSGTDGDGCVEPAAAQAVERAVRRLQQPLSEVVERRPIPFDVQRVVLADATAVDTSPPRVGGEPADQTRVAELLAALAAPAEVVALPASPASHHLVVTDRAGAVITLDLFADRVARHGEPIALRPAPGAWAVLRRPARELRDVTLWLEEPTTITELRIDAVRYRRGPVIGAWARQPAGAFDPAMVEALVALLAAPRAAGFADGPFAVAHRVTITVTPPVGAPTEHVLALGRPGAAGCPAQVDRGAIVLPAIVCTQVAALAN